MDFEFYAQRVFVTGFTEAVEFYSKVFSREPEFSDQSLGWAEFNLGGAKLALERLDANSDEVKELVGRFVGISLQVEDVSQSYRELVEQGVQFTGEPEKQVWGGTLAHFSDPEGNVISLFSM